MNAKNPWNDNTTEWITRRMKILSRCEWEWNVGMWACFRHEKKLINSWIKHNSSLRVSSLVGKKWNKFRAVAQVFWKGKKVLPRAKSTPFVRRRREGTKNLQKFRGGFICFCNLKLWKIFFEWWRDIFFRCCHQIAKINLVCATFRWHNFERHLGGSQRRINAVPGFLSRLFVTKQKFLTFNDSQSKENLIPEKKSRKVHKIRFNYKIPFFNS